MRDVFAVLALAVWAAGCGRVDPTTDPARPAAAGRAAEVKELLDAGADPNARAASGFTSRRIARKDRRSVVIEMVPEPPSVPAPAADARPPRAPRAVVPGGRSEAPAAVTATYDGSRPPRSVAEIRVHCERKWLDTGGWRMVKLCVDSDTEAFKAMHPSADARRPRVPRGVVPGEQSGAPAAVTAPYDGSRPPRSVAEIRVHCERKWLDTGGWRMVKLCVDSDTEAFKAMHPLADARPPRVPRAVVPRGQSGAPAAVTAPGARAEGGMTPLHKAAKSNPDPAAVAALIAGGADPDARAEHGVTPLHVAAGANPQPAVITALIGAGADPDARGEHGLTPLHLAAVWNPEPAVIAALIAGGADPDARAEGGATPLHLAVVRNPEPAVIAALIAGGANPGARDKRGKTPFYYAQYNKALRGTDVYWRLNEARFE